MTEPDDDAPDTTGLFSVFADLKLSIGGLTKELSDFNTRERKRAAIRTMLPRQLSIVKQSDHAVGDAATAALLDFDGPVAGRQWEVRILGAFSIVANAFVALATTSVTWYVGRQVVVTSPFIQPSIEVRWQFTSVPNFKDLGGDLVKIQPGERLLAGIVGIPAPPTSISCLAIINDLPLFAGSLDVQG